jgi:hypothetical protein
VGVGGVIVIWLEIETWVISKGGANGGTGRGHRVGGGIDMGTAGFYGPCVCFCVFLMLWWRVLVSGIAGGWCCIQLVE